MQVRVERVRKAFAGVLLALTLVGAACSAEGKVDGGGDGVEIQGDVDQNKD